MAHNLIVNYGLYKEMDIFVSEERDALSTSGRERGRLCTSRTFA